MSFEICQRILSSFSDYFNEWWIASDNRIIGGHSPNVDTGWCNALGWRRDEIVHIQCGQTNLTVLLLSLNLSDGVQVLNINCKEHDFIDVPEAWRLRIEFKAVSKHSKTIVWHEMSDRHISSECHCQFSQEDLLCSRRRMLCSWFLQLK